MMNDREIARRLGHFDVSVTEGTDGRYYVSCACRWKVRRKLEHVAVEAGVDHVSSAAQRFRAEAARAGATLVEAFAIREGRWRDRLGANLR